MEHLGCVYKKEFLRCACVCVCAIFENYYLPVKLRPFITCKQLTLLLAFASLQSSDNPLLNALASRTHL